MITPIRGRKRTNTSTTNTATNAIRNDNPDKGTETVYLIYITKLFTAIRNDNPDKGTETIIKSATNILLIY